MKIVRLFDGVKTLTNLSDNTVRLIHNTDNPPAIKKLLSIYDILQLNIDIQKRFESQSLNNIWDISAFLDLNTSRRELIVYHRTDFNPIYTLDNYNEDLRRLLLLVSREVFDGKVDP